MLSEFQKIKHLYSRAAFGLAISDLPIKTILQAHISQLLSPKNYASLSVISKSEVEAIKSEAKNKGKEVKVEARKMLKENIVELNETWMDEMVNSSAQLQEKMALFWHGHFACRVPNPYFMQQYLEIIRKNALNDFKTLLFEVSKTPAMLQFLNNQQNKKDHPNENFAREVMELFTLGRGNYTEDDIKEAARAFTGYGFDINGLFKFRKNQHDFNSKKFLQKTGNFNGDDILNIILQQPKCAYFITKKIYAFLVNDEDFDESIIQNLANKFYQSNYDIKILLADIFKSDWFYAEKNVGNKIKSPTELMVGMFRIVPTTFDKSISRLYIQRTLGQVLLNPPNVAGWKGGKSWIDSSSLLFRMRLPQIIFYDKELGIEPKEFTPEMGAPKMKYVDMYVKNIVFKKLLVKPNWGNIVNYFSNEDNSWNKIEACLLVKNIDANTTKIVQQQVDVSTKENKIKSQIIYAMSLPEYQLG